MQFSYFNCPKKGKTLVLTFNHIEDIKLENLEKFVDCEAERYVKLILVTNGHKVFVNMIKFELNNPATISESVTWLRNDLEDLISIENGKI